MKSSSQTHISRLSVKSAGVLLKLLLAPQHEFSFAEIQQLTRIGKSALYGVLHELRSSHFVKFFPPSPGSPACYRLVISLADFQHASNIHTDTTDIPDGSDQNGSSESGNGTPPCPPQGGNSIVNCQFEQYGLSPGFVEWVTTRRMEQFHESAPNYELLEQHCQYAQSQLHVKLFPNYVAANFLNPDFNYDTPTFWGFGQLAEESGYRGATTKHTKDTKNEIHKFSRAEAQRRGENQQQEKNLCVSASLRENHTYHQRPAGHIPGETPGVQANVWPRILDDLERRVTRPSFNTWLKPIELIETQPECWTFRVPDEVFVFWLETNYRTFLQDTITRHTGHTPELRFVVASLPGCPKDTGCVTRPSETPGISLRSTTGVSQEGGDRP